MAIGGLSPNQAMMMDSVLHALAGDGDEGIDSILSNDSPQQSGDSGGSGGAGGAGGSSRAQTASANATTQRLDAKNTQAVHAQVQAARNRDTFEPASSDKPTVNING